MQKIEHILLVDDNEIDNYINERIIKKALSCPNVSIQTSAQRALDFLTSLNGDFPDIIFLDIRMPGMDGFGFLDAYQKLFPTLQEHCKTYMLSSSSDPSDIERSKNYALVKNYLNKPLVKERVVKVVEEAT